MSSITKFTANNTLSHPARAISGRQAEVKAEELGERTGANESWSASGELADPAIKSLEADIGAAPSLGGDEYVGSASNESESEQVRKAWERGPSDQVETRPNPDQIDSGLGNAPCGHSLADTASSALGKLRSFGGGVQFQGLERHLKSQLDNHGKLDVKG
ncbi:MAG: hypothetical protein AB7S38_40100 [Vulcanimicrobiota bacterium]